MANRRLLLPLCALLGFALGACGPAALRTTMRGEIGDELKRIHNALGRCYTQSLRANEVLRGRVNVTFRVGESGDFENISVSDTSVKDPKLVRCVEQSLSGLGLYRPPERIVEVSYPIQFAQAVAPGGKALQSAPLETKKAPPAPPAPPPPAKKKPKKNR